MKEVITSRVKPSEVDELQSISRQTFFETFSLENTEDDMKKYLEEAFSIERLTEELNNNLSEFYFARFGDEIIGYLKVNYGESQTEIKSNNAMEIERIYVKKAFQGKNIGQLLYDKGVQLAREKGFNYIWLGVWDKNVKAIGFYKRNGFVEFGRHLFKLGDDEQTDIMMKLQLKE